MTNTCQNISNHKDKQLLKEYFCKKNYVNKLKQPLKVFLILFFTLLLISFVRAAQWPTIKLVATHNSQNDTTYIAFNSFMTKGLDPTYDAGLLKGGSDLLIYSYLVETIPSTVGVPFAIQALPDKGYNNLTIPIGLDFATGGDVVISAKLVGLSPDCKVILEDKSTNTFTDLSKSNYTITVPASSSITDRFLLHYTPQTIWIGAFNTDWNNAANWSTNSVPIATDNVLISGIGSTPVVNQDPGTPAVCNNIIIELGALLTINNGKKLIVNGNLTNND